VTHLFREHVDEIRESGEVEVALAGRPFRIRREFLDDIAEQRLTDHVANLRKALLVFHSPTDDLVGISNASHIFLAAKHPKSFVSLAGADHLLSRKSDAIYVANVINAWAERYLDVGLDVATMPDVENHVVVTETREGKFQQTITMGKHRLTADEPVSVGGLDSGPSPYDLVLAGLGACTSMTMRLYAERKALPLDRISVTLNHQKIHAADCETCETKEGMIDRIDRVIRLDGALDAEQRAKLLEIADKCPVHRTLESEIEVRTTEAA
jgi:putative redox protein